MLINSKEIKKEIYLNVRLDGRHISSYSGVEEIKYNQDANLLMLKINDRLQFIHHIVRLKEEVNTEDYVNYLALMEV